MSARTPLPLALSMVPLLVVLLLAAAATPALASCATEKDEAIAGQGTVFVATAVEQTDRYARVDVEEIWRGPDMAPSVWLQTSWADVPPWPLSLVPRAGGTSVDAQLVPGTRYLIATQGDGWQTSNCVVADASEPFVDRLRPEATRQPVESGATGAERSILEGTSGIALGLVLIASIPAAAWFAYRRARVRRSATP